MDTSDPIGAARSEKNAAHNGRQIEKEITGAGAVTAAGSTAVDSPACSLKFRGTLFGSTLAKVFTALDGVALGQVVAITTNDP
jgi:uncharacterized protein (DUF697 family)